MKPLLLHKLPRITSQVTLDTIVAFDTIVAVIIPFE
jgi:hypothetical protein